MDTRKATWWSGNAQAGEGKGIIILLGLYVTIIQIELIGIEAGAQLAKRAGDRSEVHICSDSIAAFTDSQTMTMEWNLILEYHNMLDSLGKEQRFWDAMYSRIQRNQRQRDSGWYPQLGADSLFWPPNLLTNYGILSTWKEKNKNNKKRKAVNKPKQDCCD